MFTVGTPVYLTYLHLVWSVYTSYAHTHSASLFALFDVSLCVVLLSVVRWPRVALYHFTASAFSNICQVSWLAS